jgi:hypothetical protein
MIAKSQADTKLARDSLNAQSALGWATLTKDTALGLLDKLLPL